MNKISLFLLFLLGLGLSMILKILFFLEKRNSRKELSKEFDDAIKYVKKCRIDLDEAKKVFKN